jgi:GNAT superfamily N-acetyltransferase
MANMIEQHVRIDDTSLAVLDSIDLAQSGGRRDMLAHLITRINVPEKHRGQGHGREMLALACKRADALGITLFLEPIPYSGSPMNREQLIAWYTRSGFTETAHAGILRRLPQGKDTIPPVRSTDIQSAMISTGKKSVWSR